MAVSTWVRSFAVGLASLSLAAFSSPGAAQSSWVAPENGDLVHIARAEGPLAGQLLARGRRALGELPSGGRILRYNAQFSYGLSRYLSVGIAATHLEQRHGELHKSGLGDTHVSLKAAFQPYTEIPVRLGLRQVLVLPTGFEEERAGLLPFTAREYQYAAQALLQYDAESGRRRLSAYLDPGVLLPGGDLDAYFTAGLGLEAIGFLPFGVSAFGEYAARWNIVNHDPDAEVNAGVEVPVALGLGVEIGARRRLLQQHASDLEIHLGVSLGWPRASGDLIEVAPTMRSSAALLVLPIVSLPPDPHGVAADVAAAVRTRTSEHPGPYSVFVRSVAGEHREVMNQLRHYELSIKLLAIEDGQVGGLSVPLLLRAPRAKTRITAQMELIAPDGYSVIHRTVLDGEASRGLGAELAPASSSVHTKVTPDEVKAHLRSVATERLVEQILSEAVTAIREREES